MNNFSKNVAALVVATFFYGCLDFGKDINLVSPYVTSRELEIVSKRTGIIFPVGTTGLGYFFQGSGIDDAIALKIIVPENKKKTSWKMRFSSLAKIQNHHFKLDAVNRGGS